MDFFKKQKRETGDKPQKYVEVTNRTPKRIAIAYIGTQANGDQYLVIAPYGTKIVTEENYKELNVKGWEDGNLIGVTKVNPDRGNDSQWLLIAQTFGFYYLVYLPIALSVGPLRRSTTNWIIYLSIGAICALYLGLLYFRNSRENKEKGKNLEKIKRIWQSFMQQMNLTILICLVVGTSGTMFYFYDSGQKLISGHQSINLEDLGRILQYLFISFAALLPGMLFFLFNWRHRDSIREKFFKSVLRLDPGLLSIPEAEAKYSSALETTYGNSYSLSFLLGPGLSILLSTLTLFLGWLLVIQPFESVNIEHIENILNPKPFAVTFAFLGSYFFTINMVFRRYVREDLTPKTYTHIILRILMAIILSWTLSALPIFSTTDNINEKGKSQQAMVTNETTPISSILEKKVADTGKTIQNTVAAAPIDTAQASNPETKTNDHESGAGSGFASGLLYVLAFFIGIFPETGLTVLKDLANPLFKRWFPQLEESHPLTELDGINLYDRSRFMEEGIENVENLAHHNLESLMLSTRITTNRLVDLFDQAILYLHIGHDQANIDATRKRLKAFGIRTATDLIATYEAAKKEKKLESFLKILDDQNDPHPDGLSRIQVIIDAMKDDDWMGHLQYWRLPGQKNDQYFTLKGTALVPIRVELDKIISAY